MALYLGIELSEGQLRVVKLRAQYRKLTIEGVYRLPREPGPEGITMAAQAIRASLPQTPDGVFVALPGSDASLRPLSLPKALLRRGPKVLTAELEGQIPFDVETAVIDAQVVREGEVTELIAAAARIERVQTVIDALKAADLDPREVGVMPLSLGELSSAYVEWSSAEPILVVHAYESRADLCVIASGRVQFARTLTGQNSGPVRERSIRQSLGAFLGSGGTSVVAAYLLGEEGHLYDEAVAKASGLDATGVRMYPPQGSVAIAPDVNPEELRLAPTALALALRGVSKASRIDLRKGPLAVKGNVTILRERAPLLGALLGAVMFTWLGATTARYYSSASERDRLTAALAVVTQEVFEERITDPQLAIAKARGSGETLQDPMPPADAFDVVGTISSKIPEGTRNHDITQLEVSDERVQVQGIAATVQDRDSIVEALKTYECFQNVTPGRTTSGSDNRQQYTLDVEFRCPGRASSARRPGGASAGSGSGSSPSGGATTGGSSGSN
jgi:general secretion pathway protein L